MQLFVPAVLETPPPPCDNGLSETRKIQLIENISKQLHVNVHKTQLSQFFFCV